MRVVISVFLSCAILFGFAQTNIRITNAEARSVIKGDFDPSLYTASSVENDHKEIICGLQHRISTDSLKSYIEKLEGFSTRHTYSDTLSNETGIGAARRWAYSKFQEFSANYENRLIPAYLEFDYPSGACGPGLAWRNVLAVLPGTSTEDHKVIIIEAHMDSRCAEACDSTCFAPGADDNGSGTALVIELARVLSRYSFKHSIVFMLTTGEEQGLYGASAMAQFCADENVAIKAVLNNDIVGGIECGETASPPGCPFEGHLDSTHVRLFTHGSLATPNRGLARTIKLYNDEMLKPMMFIPMDVEIMSQEDRTGRGGDHIPFRLQGFTNVRFTSANEHGDADPGPDYTDRQHTSRDLLSADLDSNGSPDEYFVNFEYLKRNAIINGTSAVMIALGPETPDFVLHDEATGLRVEILDYQEGSRYRVGVRNSAQTQTFDAMYLTSSESFIIPNLNAGETYFVSIAIVDDLDRTSPFSSEQFKSNDANTSEAEQDPLDFSIDCNLVGVEDLRSTEYNFIQVYPNPSKGIVNLRNSIKEYCEVSFYTSEGKLIETLIVSDAEIAVDLSLNHGIYFYVIVSESGRIQQGKLIIQDQK
ncbi:M20/M25/M40 family metallo-hydrolase [bacterium]|nr:M20/M25/M40 family metallo-hydrolase [bacterium]